jgi:hypothetical protein
VLIPHCPPIGVGGPCGLRFLRLLFQQPRIAQRSIRATLAHLHAMTALPCRAICRSFRTVSIVSYPVDPGLGLTR